jgi:hypothetical protein
MTLNEPVQSWLFSLFWARRRLQKFFPPTAFKSGPSRLAAVWRFTRFWLAEKQARKKCIFFEALYYTHMLISFGQGLHACLKQLENIPLRCH